MGEGLQARSSPHFFLLGVEMTLEWLLGAASQNWIQSSTESPEPITDRPKRTCTSCVTRLSPPTRVGIRQSRKCTTEFVLSMPYKTESYTF